METWSQNYLSVPSEIGDGIELHACLDLLPFVLLPTKFDAEPYFAEISKLLELKQSDGFLANYLEENFPEFANSLRSIAQINQQTKIEIIRLLPGEEKKIPGTNKKKNPITINIVIHMPEGVGFYVDTNSKGGNHAFTKSISLKSRDTFLLHTGAHSKWENPSEKEVLIFSLFAYPQIPEAEILSIAKNQNMISSHRDMINMLAAKKSFLGMSTSESHALYQDLTNWGLSQRILPSFISMAVFTEWLDEPLLEEEALQISKASLVLEQETFPISFIDSWIFKKKQEGKRFAVLLAAGTYIQNVELFLLETIRLMGEMQSENTPALAHIMDKQNRLPFLHEQFLILNLDCIETNNLKFGNPREKREMTFPAYITSQEKMHDDYTPLWISAAPDLNKIRGVGTFGTEFLADLLSRNQKIKNIPISLRQWKKFIYPSEGRGEEYRSVRGLIEKTRVRSKEKVYVFNTEQLNLRAYNIKPDVFLFPCAGLKPIALYQQFQGKENLAKCVFVEKNIDSISFYEKLLSCNSIEQVENCLFHELERQNALPSMSNSYVKNMLRNVLKESFAGDISLFMQNLNAISMRTQFAHLDYFRDQVELLSFFSTNQKTLFWHSNAWESHQAYFRMSPAELRRNYFKIVGLLTEKINKNSWVHKNAYDAVLGDDFYSPQIILSSGGSPKKAPRVSAFDPFIPPLSCL